MKKRNIFTPILVALPLILTTSILGCNNNNNSVANEYVFNIEDEVNASINTIYSIPVVFVTIDKQEIICDYSVKDSTNNDVLTSNNSFLVSDYKGYTILFTAKYKDIEYTKEVRVSVGDYTKPKIECLLPSTQTLNVGETYYIDDTKIIVSDNSNEEVTLSYKVVINDKQIPVNNKSFKLEYEGDYTLTITAKDKSSNEENISIIIKSVKKGVISSFDEENDIQSASCLFGMGEIAYNTNSKYIKSGSGSLKHSINHTVETWPGIVLNNIANGNLEGSKSLSMWIYNDSNASFEVSINRCNNDKGKFKLKARNWNYISIDSTDYDDVFVEQASDNSGLPEVGNKSNLKNLLINYTYQPHYGTVNLYLDDVQVNYEENNLKNYKLSAKFPSGEVGSEYQLPKIEIEGTSLEASYTLYAPDGQVFATRDGKFVPDVEGTYVLAAEVVDENGFGYESFEFMVSEKKLSNYFNDFESENDLDEFKVYGGSSSIIKNDLAHNGAGSLKIVPSSSVIEITDSKIKEKISQALADGFDSVVLYVYYDKATNENTNVVIKDELNNEIIKINGKEWRRVVIDIANIETKLCTLSLSNNESFTSNIYIDDITFAIKSTLKDEIRFNPFIEDFENCDISKRIDEKACVTADLTVTAHTGNLALNIQSGFTYGMFSIRGLDLLYSEARKNGYNQVSLWIYSNDVDTTTYEVWDSWNSKLQYKINAKTWTEITFDITNTKSTYQFISLTAADSHVGLQFIVDDIKFSRPIEKPFSAEYKDFDDNVTTDLDGKGCCELTIDSNTYHGESGSSLKVYSGYTYAVFTFNGFDDVAKEAISNGYTKVTMWIYNPTEKELSIYNQWNGATAFKVKPNTWTKVELDITGIANYATLQFVSVLNSDNSSGITFYIDDIVFEKGEVVEPEPEPEFSAEYKDFDDNVTTDLDGKGCCELTIDSNTYHGESGSSLKVYSGYTYAVFTFNGFDDVAKEAISNGYTKVTMWIYNPTEKELSIYNQWNGATAFKVKPNTWTKVELDITGIANYTTLQFVSVLNSDNSNGITFYVDDIVFEK